MKKPQKTELTPIIANFMHNRRYLLDEDVVERVYQTKNRMGSGSRCGAIAVDSSQLALSIARIVNEIQHRTNKSKYFVATQVRSCLRFPKLVQPDLDHGIRVRSGFCGRNLRNLDGDTAVQGKHKPCASSWRTVLRSLPGRCWVSTLLLE